MPEYTAAFDTYGVAGGWSREGGPSGPLSPQPAKALVPLFAVPFAGAGASMYRSWGAHTRRLRVVGLQLAGREERFGEAPHRTVSAAVGELADELASRSLGRYAVFGHSMGALVAFELVRELRRRGAPPPLHLFVSGRIAPQVPVATAFHALGDDALIDTLRRSGGTPEAVLAERELIHALLPTLRADFELNERYRYRQEPPLDLPITAFAGSRDTIAPIESVSAWREQTSRQFRLLAFGDGHFFVKSDETALVRVIERAMDERQQQ